VVKPARESARVAESKNTGNLEQRPVAASDVLDGKVLSDALDQGGIIDAGAREASAQCSTIYA